MTMVTRETATDDDADGVEPPPKRSKVLYRRALSVLSLARDGLAASGPAVSAGFASARMGVDAGFGIARLATSAVVPVASTAVDAAHAITKTSLDASEAVARTSIRASDAALSLAGAERGEAYRLLSEHVEGQRGRDGYEAKDALLGLAGMLGTVGGDLLASGADPTRLPAGARDLAALHGRRREERVAARKLSRQPPPPVPDPSELTSLARHMRYAAGAYGARAAKFLDVVPEGRTPVSNEDAVVALTGVRRGDILTAYWGSELYRPGHYVAVSHEDEEVVVAIRGTLSLKDVLVDLVCHSEPFRSPLDVDSDSAPMVDGRAHGGFLRSAMRLANDLHQPVAMALRANPGYRLVVVGHSLGGGCATLLSLLWARVPEFSGRDVRAFAYAAPCCVCSDVATAPFTRRHVTSVVTGDDIVSRLSFATFWELQRSLVAMASRGGATVPAAPDESPRVNRDLTDLTQDEDEKLYCGGRVWWLESKEFEPHPIVEIDPVKELKSIELFPDIFAIHMPNAYVDSLEKLDAELQQPPEGCEPWSLLPSCC